MNLLALPFSIHRAVILAPHPDDDVIAAGGLIQRVLAAGGDVVVVFVTDGENNPWPQRYLQRKLFVTAKDRAAWGAMRRREAICSLARLGVAEKSAIFLGLPDQGMSRLARHGDLQLRDALRKIIKDVQPTLIVSPSAFDLHADHRAIAHFAHGAASETPIATYVVHGTAPEDRLLGRIELSDSDRKRKCEAIECHQSQLALSRERFLSYARRAESFYTAEFDVVRVDSAFREQLVALRHAMRVCLGLYPASDDSGVKAAADVQDSAGDVAGLL